MLSAQKMKAMKILEKELKDLQEDPIVTFGVTVGKIKKDVFHWHITMVGPNDTPYAGGFFTLVADFPDDYPNHGPKVVFKNKMYHLNVNEQDGNVCMSTLTNWKKGTTMSEVLSLIFALFYKQNPNNPYDHQKAELFKNNIEQFNRNVREYTQKYANINDNVGYA